MIECTTCKMKIEDLKATRCPRCYTILKPMKKCGECKGCSIFNILDKNNIDKKCPNQ